MSGSTTQPAHLDVHGVRIELCGDGEAVQALARHFASYRRSGAAAAPAVRIELRRQPPSLSEAGRLRASQVFERGAVFNRGPQTWVDHHGQALSEYDFAADRGRVVATACEDLVELGYLMAHSRIGQLLERRGLVRLHALGLCVGDKVAVVLAPSGGGKSTMARALLRHTGARLLGDDMVLVDRRGRALGFHSPLGVSNPEAAEGLGEPIPFARRHHAPKWVVPLEGLAERLEHGPLPIDAVVQLCRVSAPPSRVLPASRRAGMAALLRDMVIGLGLPQVIELVARHGLRDVPGQLPSVAGRTRSALAVARRARFATLEVHDPQAAAPLLVRWLQGED